MKGETSIVNEAGDRYGQGRAAWTRRDVRFEKLVYGGDALARLEGQVLLAPYVLPGEAATVTVEGRSKGVLRGHVDKVSQASGERVAPECRYFARCGGCHYQHAGYHYQLEQKREILRETIRRTAKLEPPAEIAVVAGPPFEYRNRVQLHLFGHQLGYHEPGTHRVCDVERCPVSSPRINTALASLRVMTRDAGWPKFLRSLELFTDEEQVQVNVLDSGERRLKRSFFEWCEESMPGATAPTLDYQVLGHTFRVSRQSFFQVNRFLIDQLVETALEGASGARALELYAGVGLFSLELVRRFGEVTAVEWGAVAAADLRHNVERAGAPIDVVRQTAEHYLESNEHQVNFVLADPPRSGLGPAVVNQLARLSPERLTMVSCDPSTLARDLAALVAAGYALESLAMVDLFPQTCHIESVARLRRQ